LLACRKGAHVAPLQGVDQQSFIRLGTSCPTTGSLSGELKHEQAQTQDGDIAMGTGFA
jgi:hypothetical protein